CGEERKDQGTQDVRVRFVPLRDTQALGEHVHSPCTYSGRGEGICPEPRGGRCRYHQGRQFDHIRSTTRRDRGSKRRRSKGTRAHPEHSEGCGGGHETHGTYGHDGESTT